VTASAAAPAVPPLDFLPLASDVSPDFYCANSRTF